MKYAEEAKNVLFSNTDVAIVTFWFGFSPFKVIVSLSSISGFSGMTCNVAKFRERLILCNVENSLKSRCFDIVMFIAY